MRAGFADARVSQRAAEQWSVLSVSELRACGLTERQIRARVRKGMLHSLHRGVYALGHPRVPLEGRFLAAVKACGPGAALSHFSAGVLWKFLEWEERFPEVSLVGSSARRHPRLVVHRTRCLDPADIRRHKQVPVTSPARTLIDLAASFPEDALRKALRRALGVGVLSLTELVRTIDRLGRRPGSAKLKRILVHAVAPTRSELEDLVLDLILSGGFAHPDVNRPLRLSGRRVVPDFRWPRQRLVVEADGGAWHDNPIARAEDIERQALLEAHGDQVLRVTWRDATIDRQRTRERLLDAGAALV